MFIVIVNKGFNKFRAIFQFEMNSYIHNIIVSNFDIVRHHL